MRKDYRLGAELSPEVEREVIVREFTALKCDFRNLILLHCANHSANRVLEVREYLENRTKKR